LSASKKAKTTGASPAVKKEAAVAPSPRQVPAAPPAPVLKKLNTSGKNSSDLKPIVGGAASFFGVAPSATSATPPNKKKASDAGVLPGGGSSQKKPKVSLSTASDDCDIGESLSEGVFAGKRIAVTGIFVKGEHDRTTIEELIKENGGKITESVSGKTAFLVLGDQHSDGGSRDATASRKYDDAKNKNVKIVSLKDFLEMIPARAAPEAVNDPQWQSSFRSGAAASSSSSSSSSSSAASSITHHPMPSLTALAFKPRPVTSSSSSSSSSAAKAADDCNTEDLMWVDKHKPKSMSDIIGNPDIVRGVQSWLKDWEAVHIHKSKKVDWKKENPGARAMLISGPPGIGKTTMATLIGKSLGYEVLELNASDTRNKRAISEELSDVVLSRAIGFGGQMKKRMVIMDEVDGMGGSDRGGIPELIKVIKTSKTPIICICNERHSVKIKSLAGHCYDIKVKRPPKQIIAKKLVEIALKEGLRVELNAAEMLAESSGNDIRQALHAMQMWRAQATTMKYTDLRDRYASIEKDKVLRQSFFESTLDILRGTGSLNERYNSFFVDYSLIPLMIQQNYIKSYTGGQAYRSSGTNEVAKLELLSRAADAVADMELSEAGIRGLGDQHWELLPVCAGFSLRVGSIVQGHQGFPEFSAWMGKNSSKGRKHRLTQEIALHSMLSTGQGVGAVRLEYVPYLRSFLLAPLLQRGAEGIPDVIKLLDDYGLSKDDFSESLKDLSMQLPSSTKQPDPFEALDPTLKSSLTRQYNNSSHRGQALVHAEGVTKKSSKKAAATKDDEFGNYDAEDLEGVVDDDELAAAKDAEEANDVGDVSAFVKKLKKAKADEKKATKKKGK